MSARLTESDRQLFSLVTEAAFANPFGVRRASLDQEISGAYPEEQQWIGVMLERVGARLRALGGGELNVGAFAERDRELVEYTVLFEAFHRFLEPLDTLIAAQERSDVVLKVPFARDFFESLSARGISSERAVRVLELFHQMRRAFGFIKRGLVGRGASMRKLREELWRALFTHDIRRYERYLWNRMEDFATILLGETGTGKGAAAAAIGRSGFIPFDASKGSFAYSFVDSFIPINFNEFPESLFESEIFGHRKGAFTGAVDNYDGVLARCKAQGTVFFDEIGEATLPVQVKLLRVLQDRIYAPVGSRELRRFSGRIVAATHRSLPELRAAGALRDDFYYRLSSNVIEVPPLRVRIGEEPGELSELVEHLCTRIAGAAGERVAARGSRSEPSLAAEVTAAIERDLGAGYTFPGNVRELEQSVRRVLLTGGCAADQAARATDRGLPALMERGALTAEQLIERYCVMLYARLNSYVEVARLTGLDRRTVKKHIDEAARDS
jgi:DNA-binding NtrC family response regulator